MLSYHLREWVSPGCAQNPRGSLLGTTMHLPKNSHTVLPRNLGCAQGREGVSHGSPLFSVAFFRVLQSSVDGVGESVALGTPGGDPTHIPCALETCEVPARTGALWRARTRPCVPTRGSPQGALSLGAKSPEHDGHDGRPGGQVGCGVKGRSWTGSRLGLGAPGRVEGLAPGLPRVHPCKDQLSSAQGRD